MKTDISIVTINRNNREGLAKTFRSVFDQQYGDYEFIVIDGGSSDGSRELIKDNESRISYWISEPDGGIYQAHNKGLAAAHGEYLFFLNSGDSLHQGDVLQKTLPFLRGADIVYGDLLIQAENSQWTKKYNEKLTFSYFLGDTLPHQGSFIKKSVFDVTGPYDESLKIAGDWKFFIDAVCRHNVSVHYLDFVVADYDYSGISSNIENREKMRLEKRAVLENLFPRYVSDYDELFNLRAKYPLLANSRAVRAYFRLRGLFVK